MLASVTVTGYAGEGEGLRGWTRAEDLSICADKKKDAIRLQNASERGRGEGSRTRGGAEVASCEVLVSAV